MKTGGSRRGGQRGTGQACVAMGEVTVSWMVAGPVNDFSRKRCVWKIIGLLQMETT